MLFNDLLAEEKIDPAGVLVLRHTPRPEDGKLRKVLPWLAAEHPDVFNAYQSTQPVKIEAEMLRAKYVASFIGLEKRKGSTEQAAVFVGLYKVGDHRPMTYDQFLEVPAYQEMKKFGMRGSVQGDRPSVLWFDLAITDFYRKWKGKLIVEWPRPPIKWSRFADRAKFPIIAILEDSLLLGTMPDWSDCIWSWAELSTLPSKWRETLRQWCGMRPVWLASNTGTFSDHHRSSSRQVLWYTAPWGAQDQKQVLRFHSRWRHALRDAAARRQTHTQALQ